MYTRIISNIRLLKDLKMRMAIYYRQSIFVILPVSIN